MAQRSSFGSNNPFRRNGSGASVSTPVSASAPPPPFPDALDSPSDVAPTLPSSEQFRSQLQALPQPDQPPPATSFQKPKVVKRVRVQSPPPSSPESAGVPDRFAAGPRFDEEERSASDDDDIDVDGLSNPFNITRPSAAGLGSDEGDGREEGDTRQPTPRRPPPNPFQRTLQDLESGSNETLQNVGSPVGTRGAMDVDAFKRLLLTGQAGGPGLTRTAATAPEPPSQSTSASTPSGDGTSPTDTSPVSRQSTLDAAQPTTHETPRTSHEISEPEGDDDRHGLIASSRTKSQSPATLRKKPPPPSSRHGKLIRAELKSKGEGGAASRSASSDKVVRATAPPVPEPPSPLEINKPLPPAPQRHPVDEEAESVFDREAAGKVPESAGDLVEEPLPLPRPPTPPNVSHASTATTPHASQHKKPPPPPRRSLHGRSESKASVHSTVPVVNSASSIEESDISVRRSSQESTRSRSSSLRVSIHAPAPPPPRRPTHNSRPSNSFISPSAVSFSSITSAGSERSPSDPPTLSPLSPNATNAPVNGISALAPSPQGQTLNSAADGLVVASSPVHHATPHAKLFPPPPPPSRSASTRSKRPPSVSSVETPSRRVGSHALPPPPPPRQRGSSKGSVDGSGSGVGKGNGDGKKILEGALAEEPTQTISADVVGSSTDILADLTALQREVDALRGKVEKRVTG